MISEITLRRPDGIAWQVTPDGVVPVQFKFHLDAGALQDIHVDGERHHLAIHTPVGPVHVVPGQWLVETGNGQLVGMPTEAFEQVWRITNTEKPVAQGQTIA